MTNLQLINKVNRLFQNQIKLVEISRDYFELKSNNIYLSCDVSIYPSDEFKKMIKPLMAKNKKNVKWDNMGLRFWLEDFPK